MWKRRNRDRFDAPIWWYEVGFEKVCRNTLKYKTYCRYADELFNFVSAHPKKHTPEDFYITDIEDYLNKISDARGAASGHFVSAIIYRFFQWLREEQNLQVALPKIRPLRRTRAAAAPISIEELSLIHRHTKDDLDRLILREALAGAVGRHLAHKVGVSGDMVRVRFRQLRSRAGLSALSLGQLTRGYQALCQTLGRAQAERELRAQDDVSAF